MVKTPTRDELVKILTTSHRSIIREADEWRPLAGYILGLNALLTKEALLRLKRRMGQERGRLVRAYNGAKDSREFKDRCWYEINIWDLAMGMLDCEIRKCKATLEGKKKV